MQSRSLSCLGPHGFHKLNYYEWGDEANPRVLVCVHGLTRNGRDFDDLAKDLAKDYRVLCPDVVGRGQSGWLANKGDYGYPLYCADMAMLIARSGAASVDWVGTSMGGLIGMLLAAQPGSPIRRLVMNDVGPLIPKASLERLASYVGKTADYETFEEFEQYIRTISAPFGPLTDAQWRHLAQTNAKRQDNGRWGSIYDPAVAGAFTGTIADVVLWPYWDMIRSETLVIRGGDSDLLLKETAEEMTRRGPKARMVEFAGTGHAPMLMDPAQIRVLREFLTKP